MAFNWNDEMANLEGIGAEHGIEWPDDLSDSLKRAITKAEADENGQSVKVLTRAFESLVKVRNHFLTGE